MNSRQRPKHGYSSDRESYMHRVQQFMRDAFYYFVEERRSRCQCPTEVDQMSANELRRLLDLQLPQWILIAPADARFSRSLAVEQSIAEVDHRAGSIWPVALSSRAQRPAGHKVTITLSDRKQFQEMFFSWVRRRCADALSGPQPEVFPAPAANTFVVWDHLSKGLTYHFRNHPINPSGVWTALDTKWSSERKQASRAARAMAPEDGRAEKQRANGAGVLPGARVR
jgi:hypothetical protein